MRDEARGFHMLKRAQPPVRRLRHLRPESGWRRIIATALLVCLAAAPARAAGRRAESPPALPEWTIVEETAAGLTLELQIPAPQVRQVTRAGAACYQVEAPGLVPMAGTGLPAYGTLVAALHQGLRLEVVEARGRRMDAYPLCPAGRFVCDEASASLPCESEWLAEPEGQAASSEHLPLAEIGPAGSLRGVPVVQVRVYPLQVEGDQVRFFSHLRVRLSGHLSSLSETAVDRIGSPFAAILRSVLLNAPALPDRPPNREAGAPASHPPATAGSLKILVDQDGLVQVTYADLASAGWDPGSLDPRTLTLSHSGLEVPIVVEGEGDGRLDPEDRILFYGQANPGLYSRTNVYWLAAGAAPGRRMASRDVRPDGGLPVAARFPATLHAEEDNPLGYWQNPPGREGQDHWYWTAALQAPATASLSFEMPPFDSGAAHAALRIRLAGKSDDPADPDHHTRLWLNTHLISDESWDGQVEFEHSVPISPSLLLAGSNTAIVETVGDTGAAVDLVFANWLEIDYDARYVAQDDEIGFGAPAAGGWQFRVTSFGGAAVEAYDVSDPLAPVRLEGVESVPEGGGYTAVLEDTAAAASRYLALAPSRRRAPAAIQPDLPSGWHSPANGADEIILTYDGFYDDLLPLAAHRQSQGLRMQVIRLTDVYDEFSAGHVTPQAIHDLVQYAYEHWAAPAPAFVLLVGDAHLDWLDRFHTGKPIYLPSRIFDAAEVGETADDGWFARVDGDDPLPDLLIGRFPARSRADVQAMVAKAIAYEASPPAEPWASRALFVADDDMPIFESASEAWIGQLAPAYEPQRIYASRYPPGNATAEIAQAINAGSFLVTYAGHGNQDRWGTWSGGTLFATSNVAQLDNAGKLPFVSTATCLNGFFVNPLVDACLAEALVARADAGAAGVWSPTALGSPIEHQVLFSALFDALLTSTAPTLGSITTQAKLIAYGQGVSTELLATFVLFGDPALGWSTSPLSRLHLPLQLRRFGGR